MDRFSNNFLRNSATRTYEFLRLLPRACPSALIGILLGFGTAVAAAELSFKADEVVAFIGGGDVAAAQHTGHIESILVDTQARLRCRNFGWEGDTVFAQPRDYNFPPLPNHLSNAGVKVIFVHFGRMEAFAHPNELKEFPSAYETLLTNLLVITPRLVLVTPIPFERPAEPLPNASVRNDQLETISNQIRLLATKHRLPVVDLFAALRRNENGRLTDDGVQLTPRGHAIVAQAFARQLKLEVPPLSGGEEWSDAKLEKIRQLIISKNRLWFDYWRPQNWAFLAGDRTEQPSSRDHLDSKLRWFPKEMEKFLTLIADKENEISLAASAK